MTGKTVLKDFNLLATTYRRLECAACWELKHLFEQVGDSEAVVGKSGASGLVAARTALNPLNAVTEFRKILQERSYEFRYVLRVIPIQKLVPTSLTEIEDASKMLASDIGENETFRITVEKRFTKLHTSELIKAAAANIKRKVNLTNPDKILLIEIVGGVTGISLITPKDVLSVLKEKAL